MTFRHAASLLCLLVATTIPAARAADVPAAAPADPAAARPVVQMAILLDTSNSMDGLIDQARTQLWKVVNELATTRRNGQAPALQVALYEYGNSGLDVRDGYIRQVLPLTDDLDAVSEKLFSLTTNGGDEYCGWVIDSAIKQLKWSDDKDAYKVIFIAGNEPFSQGSVDYHLSCSSAIERGVMVNTIHCGSEADGVAGGWRDGAMLADGSFMCIDQDRAIVAIKAPQDEEIARLSSALNETYIAYGARGEEFARRQAAQDAAAASQPAAGAPVQRAIAKSTALYTNASWDLVDALKEKQVKLEEIKAEDLPEEMRQMTPEQRKAYVAEHEQKRGEIQQKIQALNADREKYVVEQRKQQAGQDDTLDTAMLRAVREQLTEKQFEVKN